ncbi:MAG: aldehyde dehydrogenase [Intestinibacter bartlettii]|uniref:aldehyde dehydrogenase n=1 Tax=Intestinibacter bartlettii TaxID=261299 RepID=UPI0026EFD9FA|nr:aldehyde dehydrogenase [Intestinibacter bartlettii]MDO5010509.1 aldehyde dehydrogenase [Intestinibacter bartlettii]
MDISKLVNKQKEFFETGKTKDINFRIESLNKLYRAIKKYEGKIGEALKKDLNKSEFESYMTEIGMALSDLSFIKKRVKRWSKDKRVLSPLSQFHARSFIRKEPYGVVLIMSPWNYPFLLCIEPLIGAIAAGNCAVLKVAEDSPHTSQIITEMISETFPEEYIAVVNGDKEVATELLNQKLDYIFFTGGPTVGKIVMEKAAKNLIPVTLELGGKSPCIVEESADLKVAAKRIVFGKYLNSGQTCVAPDYLLLQNSVKEEFEEYIKEYITLFYTNDPLRNEDYTNIINERHFNRLVNLIKGEKIIHGGDIDRETLKIEPTVLDKITLDSPIMQEEIFGPILPIISFDSIEEVKDIILKKEKPLALYLFTKNKKVEKDILRNISFGSGCINDTIIQLATSRMPFGGVGNSGMGAYHGKYSFDTFTHEKSIVKKYNWIDLPIRYMPYNDFKMKLLKIFLK